MTRWLWTSSAKPLSRTPIASDNILTLLTDPSDPKLDIFAIHGLNPLNKKSHAESTWTADGKLWLRDFLPKVVPNARIFLYGYNANVAFSSSVAGVREQAENLLAQVQEKRKDCSDRPIIFVAHSLGGIIVKRALVNAKAVDTYNSIWSSTYGLVFFGVPHRGGNGASFGSVLAGVARAMTGSSMNTYMEALQRDSLFAKILVDDFRQQLEDFQILSFYETQPLSRTRFLVVNKESATLGLPGDREKQIPLNGDHRQICKFASEEDPKYKQVAGYIESLAENAVIWTREGSNSNDALDQGNVAMTEGMRNEIHQIGRQNFSDTYGLDNRSRQIGSGNKNNTNGHRNLTVQMNIGDMAAEKYAEMYLQDL